MFWIIFQLISEKEIKLKTIELCVECYFNNCITDMDTQNEFEICR